MISTGLESQRLQARGCFGTETHQRRDIPMEHIPSRTLARAMNDASTSVICDGAARG